MVTDIRRVDSRHINRNLSPDTKTFSEIHQSFSDWYIPELNQYKQPATNHHSKFPPESDGSHRLEENFISSPPWRTRPTRWRISSPLRKWMAWVSPSFPWDQTKLLTFLWNTLPETCQASLPLKIHGSNFRNCVRFYFQEQIVALREFVCKFPQKINLQIPPKIFT